MIPSVFNPRRPSLLRGNLMVLGSLAAAFLLARFPLNQASATMIVPIVVAALGMAETFRCTRMRWSWYQGAVLVSLYMNVMALIMILFLALYPFLVQVAQ